ncbi:MAG: response regulator transcription factor [Candidatus Omnitrophica bacterium]|nr:response regulator transcription factor [Candidatus Omnitrophota bacterium]
MKPNILIVEDDPNISRLVKYNLELEGYVCCIAESGEQGLDLMKGQAFDLIILDVMLPLMDGFEICKRIKQDQRYKGIPVIMLTAKGEEIDRIVGLELGADDYIVKPFSPRELHLRVRAILRRFQPEDLKQDVITTGDLHIDVPCHRVTVKNKEIRLTSMEFKLLYILVLRNGRVQTRDMLLEDVWEMDTDVTTRTIDTHVKRLRQKLGSVGDMIETVRGHGYRFRE